MKNVSILKRSIIIIYDLLILLALVIILSFPLASFSTLDSSIYLFLHQFYVYLIAQIYFVFFWSNGRSTLGMKTWKTIIINDDGTQLRLRNGEVTEGIFSPYELTKLLEEQASQR